MCLVPVASECPGGLISGVCFSEARLTLLFASDASAGPNGCGAVYAQCEAEADGGRVATRAEYDTWIDAGNSAIGWGVTSSFNANGLHWLHGWSEIGSNGYFANGAGEFAGQSGNCEHHSRYFLCVKPFYPLGSTSCEPETETNCHPDNLLSVGDRCEW